MIIKIFILIIDNQLVKKNTAITATPPSLYKYKTIIIKKYKIKEKV